MATITYGRSVKETAKSRRHARRRAAAIERDNLERIIDAALGAMEVEAAPLEEKRVGRVLRAISLTEYKACPRIKPEQDYGSVCLPQVAIYSAGYRKPTKSIYQAR